MAGLFGHEAALFTPTGSMANVLAVRSLVGVGQEVLCEASAHIARAELGAHGAYTGLTMRTWIHPRGQVDLAAIQHDVRPRHGAVLRADRGDLGREHPQLRRRSGAAAARTCATCGSSPTGSASGVHLDGARIWNAHVATGVPLAEYGAVADVMAVCLSKGLGAPVGSLMVGGADAIAEARVWRKRMGGGMRQVGILAAAGLHALDHHVERLADDHEHARLLAEACGVDPATVDTNIVVVDVGRRRGVRRGGPRRGRRSSRPSARPPYGWSRTSTSPATTPRRPPRSSPASEGPPAGVHPIRTRRSRRERGQLVAQARARPAPGWHARRTGGERDGTSRQARGATGRA